MHFLMQTCIVFEECAWNAQNAELTRLWSGDAVVGAPCTLCVVDLQWRLMSFMQKTRAGILRTTLSES